MVQKPPTGRDRRRLTLDALADVDSGRVIDHPAVEVWTDSLDQRGFVLDPKSHADFLAMLEKPLEPSEWLRARMKRKPSWER